MVSYDLSRVFGLLPSLLQALPTTLWIMFVTALIGSLLGGLLAWAQIAEEQSFAGLARGYIFILRCTPPIVLLFLVFYGIPEFLEWWLGLDINNWSRTVFVIITMILLFAAMIAEVFKAAYLAVPKGQTEAGLSIGLTPVQTFLRIVLPQAFRIALPNLISRNLGNYSLETYTAVALIYWGIALVVSLASQLLEKSLTVKER